MTSHLPCCLWAAPHLVLLTDRKKTSLWGRNITSLAVGTLSILSALSQLHITDLLHTIHTWRWNLVKVKLDLVPPSNYIELCICSRLSESSILINLVRLSWGSELHLINEEVNCLAWDHPEMKCQTWGEIRYLLVDLLSLAPGQHWRKIRRGKLLAFPKVLQLLNSEFLSCTDILIPFVKLQSSHTILQEADVSMSSASCTKCM